MRYRIRSTYNNQFEIVEDEYFIFDHSQDSINKAINYYAAELQFDINYKERILDESKQKQKLFMKWLDKNEKEVYIDEAE